MTTNRRRLMLGIGAALLVGGWGTTRYADEQQQQAGESLKYGHWFWGGPFNGIPGRVFYGGGVICMALGAGLIGFGVLRPTNRKDE